MGTPTHSMGKLMKDRGEKLKYRIPHNTYGAPNWGLDRIESM
jgi:hypothetical protein